MKILILLLITFFHISEAGAIHELPLQIHGFGLGSYSFRTNNDEKVRDLILSEERFRLDLSAFSPTNTAGLKAKADFVYDGMTNETKPDLREIYIDSVSETYSIRIGKQIITWGTGDLLFINDIFPKDWNAFYSGQDMEYLKIGAEAVKFSLYPDFASIEIILMPTFKSDNTPSSDKFIFSNPFAKIKNQTIKNPDQKIKDMESGLRIYRQAEKGDISFYFYRGFYRTPSVKTYTSTEVTYFYPELNVYGASYQINSLGGVISLETGYYESRNDKNGSDPFIDNSKYKFLMGYGRQITGNLHMSAQYYGESMRDYGKYKDNLPPGFSPEREIEQTVTLRLTQFLKYETWKLSLFGFYGIDEKDYFLIPEVSYKLSDDLSLTAGGNIIGGDKDYTTFGRFKKNDNIYMRVKYDF